MSERLSLIHNHLLSKPEIVIVAAGRSGVGQYVGQLADLHVTDLAAQTLKKTLEKHKIDPQIISHTILGMQATTGYNQAPAKTISLKAGLPDTTVCYHVNKQCASGMKAIMTGMLEIWTGHADVVACVGAESMSNFVHLAPQLRDGFKGPGQLLDTVAHDALEDPVIGSMGVCADCVAGQYKFDRQLIDEFANLSHQRSKAAQDSGIFDSEIVDVITPKGKLINKDQLVPPFKPVESQRPFFTKEGVHSVGSSSALNDGAAAIIITTRAKAQQLRLPVLGSLLEMADAEQFPMQFTATPVLAIQKVLQRGRVRKEDVDLYEINEAFAVVGVVSSKALEVGYDKINIYGGAISLGHPVGASGIRIIVTLLNALRREGGSTGVASICNGGGGASALLVRLNR